MVLSCNGVRDWYDGLAQRFLDARTLFSAPELEYWSRRTVPQSELDHKQAALQPFEQEIVDRAVRAFDVSEYQLLHPSFLFRTRGRLQKDRALDELTDVLQFEACRPSAGSLNGALPKKFVAFSLAPTAALPASERNMEYLRERLATVSGRSDVVIVDVPPPGLELAGNGRVHLLDATVPEAERLALQTSVLARARMFVGGFGDLTLVAAACGTPVTAYHSERVSREQEERLRGAAAGGWGAVSVQRVG